LLVRSGSRATLQRFLGHWREALSEREERRVRWALDVDPQEV
jgi:primosomal protein N'